MSYISLVIIIQLACAYNIDDLYHTGRSNPPGMEKVAYICVYYTYNIIILIEGQTVDYIKIESENQKSGQSFF